jgi:hypothetical protein
MKEDEMDRKCSTHGDLRNAYKILVGQPEGKIPFGRPRRKRKIIIQLFLKKYAVRI